MELYAYCPLCTNIFGGTIYQCLSGHLLCCTCSEKVGQSCPSCGELYGTVKSRNLVLEGILDSMTFPCIYKDEGCKETCRRQDIDIHGNSCGYKYLLFFIDFLGKKFRYYVCMITYTVVKDLSSAKNLDSKTATLVWDLYQRRRF